MNQNEKQGVYKLWHNNLTYYRIGYGAKDALIRLARELRVAKDTIQILDNGAKQ